MRTLSRYKYIACLPAVGRILSNYPDKVPYELAGLIAVATHCPILIVCQFIGELTSFSPELVAMMSRLKDFYHIDEIDFSERTPAALVAPPRLR